MSGRWFSATECLDMGLVWRVIEDDELLRQAHAIAAEIGANPIPSLIATKQLMLSAGRPEKVWAAHAREAKAYESLMGGPANQEAVQAFLEKRDVDFSKIPGL